eukprot:1544589-Pyramimonas_sp.AAC.1
MDGAPQTNRHPLPATARRARMTGEFRFCLSLPEREDSLMGADSHLCTCSGTLTVSRFHCKSDYFEFEMWLDVNVDIYPLMTHDKFNLGLAYTLSLDGTLDEGFYDQVRLSQRTASMALFYIGGTLHDLVDTHVASERDRFPMPSPHSKAASLADKYEYVLYGKLYKYQEDMTSGQLRVEIYISFGGLLMLLKIHNYMHPAFKCSGNVSEDRVSEICCFSNAHYCPRAV